MSSSQDCTCERCQQTLHLQAKRLHNNLCSNRRQDIRHHHGKRRCPPTKKDLFPKDISLKGKFNKKLPYNNIPHFLLFSDCKNQQKNNAATPSKYKVQEQNPIMKLNSNTTFGIENILHAVGQSQRQKLMKCSPSPNSFNEAENITKNQPLTDRDRKINDPLRGHMIINMQKKRAISQLDQNFLKNFVNPQKKIQQIEQASPSEGKSDK